MKLPSIVRALDPGRGDQKFSREYEDAHRLRREAAKRRAEAQAREPGMAPSNLELRQRDAEREAERERQRREWEQTAGTRARANRDQGTRVRAWLAAHRAAVEEAKCEVRRAVRATLEAALAGEAVDFDAAAAAAAKLVGLQSLGNYIDDVASERWPNMRFGVLVDRVN